MPFSVITMCLSQILTHVSHMFLVGPLGLLEFHVSRGCQNLFGETPAWRGLNSELLLGPSIGFSRFFLFGGGVLSFS